MRARLVAAERVRLGERDAPAAAVITERVGAELDQTPLLSIVQDPDEVPEVRHSGYEQCGIYLSRRSPEHPPRAGQVALGERYHRSTLDAAEVGRPESERPV